MPTESIVLRRERRSWALTQHELASLLGLSSAQHVSRVECTQSAPGLKFVLAAEVVFGIRAKRLFPKQFNDIEEEVARNLVTFGERLKEDSSPTAARKRQLIDNALIRIAASD